MDVCGPFTLEQLDLFGGNLDALPYSLDDVIWTLNTTCVHYGNGAVNSAAIVTAGAFNSTSTQGAITSAGTVTASVARIKQVESILTAAATVGCDAIRIRTVDSTITATAMMDGSFSATFDGEGIIVAQGSFAALAGYIVEASVAISSDAEFVCNAYKMGDEWVIVADQPNTWSDVAAQSNTWTQQSIGSNTWQRIG
jgi:hypothetical protein